MDPFAPSHTLTHGEPDLATGESLERELADIDRSFQRGEMAAFGVNKHAVLERFDELRELQVELFHKHVGLEMEFRNIEPEHEFDSPSKFCSHFTDAFEEQSAEVAEISGQLEAITSRIADLNRLLQQDGHSTTDQASDGGAAGGPGTGAGVAAAAGGGGGGGSRMPSAGASHREEAHGTDGRTGGGSGHGVGGDSGASTSVRGLGKGSGLGRTRIEAGSESGTGSGADSSRGGGLGPAGSRAGARSTAGAEPEQGTSQGAGNGIGSAPPTTVDGGSGIPSDRSFRSRGLASSGRGSSQAQAAGFDEGREEDVGSAPGGPPVPGSYGMGTPTAVGSSSGSRTPMRTTLHLAPIRVPDV